MMMNTKPMFWTTTHNAMLLSTFVALGRIFDQNSRHNFAKLILAVSRNLSAFSLTGLACRKQRAGLTQREAEQYVASMHELSSNDLTQLRKEIAHWRRIYESRYRAVRDKVFAHRVFSNMSEADELFAGTDVNEMMALFGFLSGLYSALWGAYHNGFQPSVRVYEFVLPPDPPLQGRQMFPGERIYREAREIITSIALEGLHN